MIQAAKLYLFKWLVWLFLFVGLSNLLVSYESLMNYSGALTSEIILITGAAAPMAALNTTNLFNEGLIGYAILGGMAASALMFTKELFSLQKYLKSLVYTSDLNISLNGGEC